MQMHELTGGRGESTKKGGSNKRKKNTLTVRDEVAPGPPRLQQRLALQCGIISGSDVFLSLFFFCLFTVLFPRATSID